MGTIVLLALLFASISLVVYALLSGGSEIVEARSETFVASTESRLRGLFVFADTRRLVVLYALALPGLPLLALVLGRSPVGAAIVLVALVVGPRIVLARLVARRRAAIDRDLPDALAQIAGAMRAGSTFGGAIRAMVEEQRGPLGQEFGLLLREQRLGARLEEALDNLGERVQSEEMDLVISAALIAQDVGGNLAEILQRLSETIRRKLEMEGKIRALTSQGVLQGRVVTALPFGVLGVLLVVEPEATRPIFTGLLGWCCLAAMAAMQIVGALMIRKIVRIEI